QWDAALRSALRWGPAESSDPAPLEIRWIGGVEQFQSGGLPDGPVLVVADSFDGRQDALLTWLEETRGPCGERQFGGPAFGMVIVRDCQ
ncbi:MAG: hypothetical protein ACAH65_00800, partial [Chloroflexota bacterium]